MNSECRDLDMVHRCLLLLSVFLPIVAKTPSKDVICYNYRCMLRFWQHLFVVFSQSLSVDRFQDIFVSRIVVLL